MKKRIFSMILIGAMLLTTAVQARHSMTYLYFGSPSNYASLVDGTDGSIDEVSPNYFSLNTDGSLAISDSGIADFVAGMGERDIIVVPFIANHWDRALAVAALENMDSLTDEIVAAVIKYQLHGINVDFENLTHIHRDDFSKFIALLAQKLPDDKILTVCVAANPEGYTAGWHGSYDYAALANYADYLMIMTYDEHYEGGSAGAIASYSFVEKSIKYALNYAKSEQIIIGIPFFGRIWSDNDSSVLGEGLSHDTIATYIEKYNGKTYTDSATGSQYAKITITNSGDKYPAGSYTIWYEGETSQKNILSLVDDYDLYGVGSWSLSQEFDDIWDYFSIWLNGYEFTDIEGHWAMQEIISMANEGLMNGQSATNFAPDATITRAEVTVLLCRILALTENTSEASSFSDTETHWARGYLLTAKNNGLIIGIGDELFAPETAMTRRDIATLFSRSLETSADFSDEWFNSDAGITRAEVASLVDRIFY